MEWECIVQLSEINEGDHVINVINEVESTESDDLININNVTNETLPSPSSSFPSETDLNARLTTSTCFELFSYKKKCFNTKFL